MASILFADDDPKIQTLLRSVLEERGYEVRMCADGMDLLDAFAERPADAVLLDVNMPGMTGLEVCRELRRRPDAFDVPILMVSGLQGEEGITECLSSGADDYIVKPFRVSELLAKVGVALQKRRARLSLDYGLRPGALFAGRFQVVRPVGAGGFSMVFLAQDMGREEDVALKVFNLSPSQRSNTAYISSLLREAYELSKIDFRSIVRFLDFGHSGVFYYVVMEYLEGQTLEEVVEKNGPMEEREVVVIGHEIGAAIDYLDDVNMMHRDIKPSNVMLTSEGEVKLVDFGLAKNMAELTLSVPDEIHVTPAFTSPESFDPDRTVDVSSDVYSLGATMYYAATGELPFPGNSLKEILAVRFKIRPKPLCELKPDISEELVTLIEAMMAEESGERPEINTVVQCLAALAEEDE